MVKERVLLVDTNRGSYPLLKTLERAGYEVTTIGGDSMAPLAQLCKTHIEEDYSKRDKLKEVIENYDYTAVIPGCTDASYLACSSLDKSKALGIDKEDAVKTIFNKQQFRAFARRAQIAQPREFVKGDVPLGSSIIIKPVDSFSGRGVVRIEKVSASKLEAAIKLAGSVSDSNGVIIEEFIDGQLYSHSAFIHGREIQRDFFVKEDCIDYEYAVDTSCLASDLPNNIKGQMRESIKVVADLLKLKDGLIHAQFIMKQGKAYIIEVTRRHPGDLYGLLIEYAAGYDYSSAYLNAFLPQPISIREITHSNKYIIRHTVTAGEGGDLWALRFNLPVRIKRLVPLACAGNKVSKAPKGRIAILFLESRTEEEHHKLYQSIVERKLYSFVC